MTQRFASVYADDALEGREDLDIISPAVAPTLDAQFRERVKRSGSRVAYIEYDEHDGIWRRHTWQQIQTEVLRWQTAFKGAGLKRGNRVALHLRNSRFWVIFDQAALGLGLVVVPLYVDDRPENIRHMLEDSGASLLFLEESETWRALTSGGERPVSIMTVIALGGAPVEGVVLYDDWLPEPDAEFSSPPEETGNQAGDLASIVYTSGTTGRPKGVMLSHGNFVRNAYSGLRSVALSPSDVMLSILPLSHTLERTVGYYIPLMAGAQIAYNRSLKQLAQDLQEIRPTGVITVPKIFERSYGMIRERIDEGPPYGRWLFDMTVAIGWRRFQFQQGRGPWDLSLLLWPVLDRLVAARIRSRFGGRLRLAVVGGAPCPPPISKAFIGLNVVLLQGYGLTESSPSISINTLTQNKPDSIGLPLRDVEVKIGDNEELLARGPNIMMGYWNDRESTSSAFDEDGWLHTGDQAVIRDGYIYITGRIKDILVLANGEKISPADMESAIAADPLFEQVMVVGEGMPYLTALIVLQPSEWRKCARKLNVDPLNDNALTETRVEAYLLSRIGPLVSEFPGYARIENLTAMLSPWTLEDGLLTPTLKIKRPKVRAHFQDDIDRMYPDHELYEKTPAPG